MSVYREDELYHHGIKGQRWGVRRTDAQLGHKTSSGGKKLKKGAAAAGRAGKAAAKSVGSALGKAGKAIAGAPESIRQAKIKSAQRKEEVYNAKAKALAAKQALKDAKLRAKGKMTTEEQRRADIDKASRSSEAMDAQKQKWAKDPKALYEHRDQFTDKELGDAITRINREQQLKAMLPTNAKRGRAIFNAMVQASNDLENINKMYKNVSTALANVDKVSGGSLSSKGGLMSAMIGDKGYKPPKRNDDDGGDDDGGGGGSKKKKNQQVQDDYDDGSKYESTYGKKKPQQAQDSADDDDNPFYNTNPSDNKPKTHGQELTERLKNLGDTYDLVGYGRALKRQERTWAAPSPGEKYRVLTGDEAKMHETVHDYVKKERRKINEEIQTKHDKTVAGYDKLEAQIDKNAERLKSDRQYSMSYHFDIPKGTDPISQKAAKAKKKIAEERKKENREYHAALGSVRQMKIENDAFHDAARTKKKTGSIKGMAQWVNPDAEHSDISYGMQELMHCEIVPADEELYHAGIKGQKWGVRRYQNPDGSLTAQGKLRYAKSEYKQASRAERKALKTSDRSEDKLARNARKYHDGKISADKYLESKDAANKNVKVFFDAQDRTKKAKAQMEKAQKEVDRAQAAVAKAKAQSKLDKKEAKRVQKALNELDQLQGALISEASGLRERHGYYMDKANKRVMKGESPKYKDKIDSLNGQLRDYAKQYDKVEKKTQKILKSIERNPRIDYSTSRSYERGNVMLFNKTLGATATNRRAREMQKKYGSTGFGENSARWYYQGAIGTKYRVSAKGKVPGLSKTRYSHTPVHTSYE